MTTTTERYHIGDLLSITTDRLVSPNHMDGVYAVVRYMTGVPHETHQLSRGITACKPHLLRQHPWLEYVTVPEGTNADNLTDFLDEVAEQHGEYHEVEPIPEGEYEAREPLSEMVEMMGDRKDGA